MSTLRLSASLFSKLALHPKLNQGGEHNPLHNQIICSLKTEQSVIDEFESETQVIKIVIEPLKFKPSVY